MLFQEDKVKEENDESSDEIELSESGSEEDESESEEDEMGEESSGEEGSSEDEVTSSLTAKKQVSLGGILFPCLPHPVAHSNLLHRNSN